MLRQLIYRSVLLPTALTVAFLLLMLALRLSKSWFNLNHLDTITAHSVALKTLQETGLQLQVTLQVQQLLHKLCQVPFSALTIGGETGTGKGLAAHILHHRGQHAGRRVRHIPTGIWQQLYQHHWPGNVRELRNVIERCVLFAEGEEFPREWLRLGTPDRETPLGPAQADGNWLRLPLDGSMALEDMDRFIIQNALERNDCNVMATARALKATRETVRYRISKYHLKVS